MPTELTHQPHGVACLQALQISAYTSKDASIANACTNTQPVPSIFHFFQEYSRSMTPQFEESAFLSASEFVLDGCHAP
jgi:hypothetical protein